MADVFAVLPQWVGRADLFADTGVLGGRRLDSLAARVAEGGELTPVMARLGRVDTEF
jgi:hypothetical protein